MRKVLIEKKVYKFEELSKEAQSRVLANEREWWQSDFDLCVQDFLMEKFPNSDLKYQFSLSYCQGDGFNFYGKIDMKDIVKIVNLSVSEIKTLNEINEYLIFKKRFNRRYCYSLTFSDHFNIDDILSNIEYEYEQNPKLFDSPIIGYESVLIKILNGLRKFFTTKEKDFESLGYDMIYPSIESCIKNGVFDEYEYFENGDIFEEGEV